MAEEVADGDGKVVVGIEQPGLGHDDAVTVGIGVIAERDLVAAAHLYQVRHGEGTGTVHADLSIVIHGHEGEAWIHGGIDDLQVQLPAKGDGLPVGKRGAAQGIDAALDVGVPDRFHVDDVRQILDVRSDEIVQASGRGLERRLDRHAAHAAVALAQNFVRAILNPCRDVGVGRPTIRRVVLEAAIRRRIVRRCDDDSVA